jgi:CheY-like chemotaxis protein/anti-sigma regulatory factor (Ser/Thr protein kinase)
MDPAGTLRDALEALAPSIQAKGIELRRALDPECGVVWGDPQRVQQVVWNLVNNAVKFTPRGGTVSVELERDGPFARIAVADTGQGIKPDFLPHIFERFRQQDATTKRNQGGLGLGLSIVKRLVEMHGGTVTARSAGEGRGATFTVRLPLATGREAAGVLESEAGERAAAGPMPLRGVRVLVVDDDGDARAVLKHVLARAGADVREAADVSSALDQLAAFHPQVLLSDVGMPRQDGYDLIRAVRGRGYSAEELPAIALTAFARSEDRSQSLSAGFQMHLSKPVHAHEVVAAIASVAGGR